MLTRIVVDPDDPAFSSPTKFIGPVYPELEARSLATQHGWTIAADGDRWRRVVASPEPRRIVQRDAIERLVEGGFLVICAGGGGIPVTEDGSGRQSGIEAVIDKDLASSLLAENLRADVLVLATDVPAVYAEYHTDAERAINRATPPELRAMDFAGGSMGPKVEAACRFVERTGGRAAIGALGEIQELLDGRSGTQVLPVGSEHLNHERRAPHVRAA
jgi:carbamate kinase